jgi:hypothetical protein
VSRKAVEVEGWMRWRRGLGRQMAGDARNAGDKLRRVSVDRFRNVIASDVDEYYLLCSECGRILFDDIEAADRSLKGLPITEDE